MFTCNKTMWKKGVRESRVRGGPLVATEGNTSGGPEPTEDKVYRELLAYIAALPQGHVTTSPTPKGHVTSSQATKVCDCLFHGGPPEHFQTQRFLRGTHGKNHESVLTYLAARLFGFPPRHPVGCLALLPEIMPVVWVSSQISCQSLGSPPKQKGVYCTESGHVREGGGRTVLVGNCNMWHP